MKYIREGLKKNDSIFQKFSVEFSMSMKETISEYFPEYTFSEIFDQLIGEYSTTVFNATETVIDKDRSYPIYRLEEELTTMNKLSAKILNEISNDCFAVTVYQKVKEILVKYFDEIFELSSTGFRLLDKNILIYNWEFVTNFYSIK